LCEDQKFLYEGGCGDNPDRSLTYEYPEGGGFFTGPNFGCVHQEPISEATK